MSLSLEIIYAAFLFQTNRLIYYIALPLLFQKIGTSDFFATSRARSFWGRPPSLRRGP